ncbi:MAG: ABC transporter ATP-binding protein [Bifidobacterium sp.]|uniref:Putative hemin import ATP-binding protein HrtA n=1 Tax=Bifidobacterium fermentum TaxID=3059035 RepID=A0AB39UCR1_9BIFI
MVDEILVMEHVTKTFGHGHTALTAIDDASLTVSRGQFVSIVGPSGSGKSSLLTISAGLQRPTSGEVSINGIELGNLRNGQLTAMRFTQIGFVLQRSNLIPYLTVYQQLALVDKVAKRATRRQKIREVLESLDIRNLADKHPRDLSGGERQRAAIARALYGDPSLILADEPTASLDTDHAYDVVRMLAEQTRTYNKATVMVTHDVRMTEASDVVYRMEDGRLSMQ